MASYGTCRNTVWRNYLHPDPDIRHAMQWYTRMGRRVVVTEVRDFLTRRRSTPQSVAAFWGSGAQLPEDALARLKRADRAAAVQEPV